MLWNELPPTSRCKADEGGWSSIEYMLRSLEYTARVLAWQNTKDAQKGRNQPIPIKTPAERAEAYRKRDAALSRKNEIAKRFGIV